MSEKQKLAELEAQGAFYKKTLDSKIKSASVYQAEALNDIGDPEGSIKKKYSKDSKVTFETAKTRLDELLKNARDAYQTVAEVKSTNMSLNGKYDNEKENKEDVELALKVAKLPEACQKDLNSRIQETDDYISISKRVKNEIIDSAVETFKESLHYNDKDKKRAGLEVSAKERKRAKISLCTAGIFQALAIILFAIFYVGWGVFCEILAIGIFVLAVRFLKTVKEVKAVRTNGLLNKWTEEAYDYVDKSDIREIFDNQLNKYYNVYEKYEAEYLEYRNKFNEEFNVVYKDIYSLCSDFLNLLPAEFRSYKCLTDMNELLEGNRADTLREAYAILEVRYREERRDRETQTFRENQNYYASQQAEAQRKAAEYAKQEMEESQRQTEYAKQQAEYAKRQAEYAKQTAASTAAAAAAAAASAKSNEKAAEEARTSRQILERNNKS